MVVQRLARIAHPTNLTAECELAYHHALRLAVANNSQLDVLHVDPNAHLRQDVDFPSARRILTGWGIENGALGRIRAIAAYGREPVHPLLSYIDECLPDLIVLATHRRQGLDRLLHKQIASKLARTGRLPTLFVPCGEEGFVSPSTGKVHLRQILLPIDWLPQPQVGVELAVALADVLGCDETTFTLLHVGEDPADFPAVETVDRPGWFWRQLTRDGNVVEAIVGVAEEQDADLVVMVTKGHEGFLDALRGSTTERVLQRILCPLLAVPDRDTPAP